MPYGFRIVRAMFFGVILLAVAGWFLWPIDLAGYGIPPQLQRNFHFTGLYIYAFLFSIAAYFARPVSDLFGSLVRRVSCMVPQKGAIRFIPTGVMVIVVLGLIVMVIVSMIANIYDLSVNFDGTIQQKIIHVLRAVFVYLISFIPIALGMLPVLFVYQRERIDHHPVMRQWFLQGRGGMARFAGPSTYDKHGEFGVGINTNPDDKSINGMYLGRTLFSDDFSGRDIIIEDDGHILTIGQPGSGKSVTAIWPNLALYSGSAIVIDPKGEHARMFAGHRQGSNKGGTRTENITKVTHKLEEGTVFILDPFDANGVYPSAHYNPLSEIDIESDTARKLISAISGSSIVASKGENHFWEEAARVVLDGVIAHVLSSFPRSEQTLPVVADLLMGNDPETGFADPQRFEELLVDMRMNSAAGGLPKLGASTLDDLGERARGNVIAELRTAIKWTTDPAMREHLKRSDFSFASIGRDQMTVFVALPFGFMAEQMRWLRTITEVSMRVLEDRKNKSETPILYVLDELPQYGAHLKAIKEGMVTLRSAGVKLWAFVQNMKQLDECFGRDGAKNFQSGGTVQVFGVSDEETARWVSQKLGKHRVPDKAGLLFRMVVGMREEDLVPSEEVEQVLGKTSDIQYIFRSGNPPMRLRRIAYKPLTIEGRRFKGLPLGGYYDEC